MNDKLFAQEFAKELDAESPASLKCLERIPPELFDFKPHEKSMAMGYLALLVAEIPLWITFIIKESEIDFATFKHKEAKTTQDLVDHFNENMAGAKEALLNVGEGGLDDAFYLKANGNVLITSTKRQQVESTINHLVHHRGQLTVYMRLNDIAVPSITARRPMIKTSHQPNNYTNHEKNHHYNRCINRDWQGHRALLC